VVVAEQKVVAHGEARAVVTAEILSEAYQTQVKVQWTDQGLAHISIVG
jgi:ABC-type cobalamin/Fe3+-siderophores transport system ATPase subunit